VSTEATAEPAPIASSQPIPLGAVLLDSNDQLAEGEPPAGQPVEDLVTRTALGGFGPSAAPKKEKPPVELHKYDSPFFQVVGKRAMTNNTIDFVLTRKSDVSLSTVDSNDGNDIDLAAAMIDRYAAEEYAKGTVEFPGAPEFSTLDYSLTFNLKPVQGAEKIVRDLGGSTMPTGDDATIYAFILLSPNAPVGEDKLLPVPRSIRINDHVSTMLFYAVAGLVKDCFNRGEIGGFAYEIDGELTMEKIRRAYLGIVDTPAAPKPAQGKKEVKGKKAPAADADVDEGQPTNHANTDPRHPRAFQAPVEADVVARKPASPREQREQHEGDPGSRSSDRVLQRHIEQTSSRHEELMAQLRINQKQQGQIIEGQSAILADNETLFKLMNLVLKTLEGKK
jgi:hypothetical protein